jgi:hypothetical protein
MVPESAIADGAGGDHGVDGVELRVVSSGLVSVHE